MLMQPRRLLARAIAVLIVASILVVGPPPEATEAQDHPEWACDGTPILMRGGKFHYIIPDPDVRGNLSIQEIPGTSGIWNSTGYDPITNLVYGVGSVGGEKTVRAYDANGDIVFQTQIQDPYPDNAGTYAGTVLGDGRYIIHSVGAGNGNGWYNGARFNLWSIDPVSGSATYIGSTPVNFADFSYNPLDGYLYQVVNRVLYRVNPNDGSVTTTPMPAAFPNGGFGASWFDAAGFLYLFRNRPGDIFKVDPNDTSTWVEVGEPGSDGGTDAASCVSQIDVKKDVVDANGSVLPNDRVYSVGDTVTYQITLINNGLPTQNRTVDLCDALPGDGRTFTGTWTSTDPSTTITSGGAAGDTSVCFEADMPSSLWTDPANPGSDPTVITIEVLIGPDTAPGGYENQATLDFDQDGVVDVVSDDPGDGSDPRDPTTIEVRGAFTVTKTVVGHPVANDADTFTMTVSCTTATGATHTVSAGAIRNASTNAAWPGAGTNTFTIAHGDEVKIDNVPAGTTCTVTEAASTAYATTVTVIGSPAAAGATSTGTPAAGTLVSDNCQDGNGNAPFNLQIRNATGTATNWEMIWRNRPYSTIPGLSAGPYTHAVVAAPGGLFDHVFTGTTPLNGWSNLAITGGLPTPAGGGGCGEVEHYIDGTGVATPASSTAELTIDAPIADEAVAFTNSTSVLQLTKTTSTAGGLDLEDDGEFTFDIACDNGLTESVTLTTDGGSATIGYPDMPLVAAGATCTFSEVVPVGWQLTSGNDIDVTSESGTPQGVTFANERLVADLTVSKVLIGIPDGVDPTTYTFDLAVSCTGGFANDPYTTAGTFRVDAAFIVEDLPVGSTCTVTEAAAAGFTTWYRPAQTVDIAEGGSTVEVTNSTGALIVDKTTQVPNTHPIDPVATFDFRIECTGPDGTTNDTYSVTADSPEATGASGGLAHADVGLKPSGTSCVVTELVEPGWTLASAPSVTLDVTEAEPEPTASFLNTRDVGSLTITKTLDGVPAAVDLDDEPFTVDVSCSGGFTVDPYVLTGLTVTATTPLQIDDLPTGASCTVTERPDPRFTSTGSPSTVTIDADGETVALTNTTSSFSLDKVTAGSALAGSTDGTFSYTIVCTDAGGGEIVAVSTFITTTSGSGSADPSDLPLVPPGSTCTVTESVPFGWTLTGRTGGTNVGASGIEFVTTATGSTIGFENTLDSATLTINKDVTGADATPALEAETFTINVECTGNFPGGVYQSGARSIVEGSPVVIDDLPVGSTCTVTEDADPRFVPSFTPSDTITIPVNGSSITIENETSTFSITKKTSVPAADPSTVIDDGTFEFSIECTLDSNVIYSDTVSITTTDTDGVWDASPFLAPGTSCAVTETPVTGWTLVEPSTQTVVTSGDTTETLTFTNRRDLADLTISKTLLGDLTQDFTNTAFNVEVTCTGDFDPSPLTLTGLTVTANTPLVIEDLPTGAVCTVTELFDSRFSTFYAPENSAGTAAVVTIEESGALAGIANAGGEIAIRKDTVGPIDHPLGLLADFTFNFSCSNGYSGTHVVNVAEMSGPQGIGVLTYDSLPPFPLNATCTITEVPPPGWTTTSANPQTIEILSDKELVQFVNERNAGTLTVSKVLDGVPPGVDLSDEAFTVDVTCTGGGLTTDPYVIADQTITANLPLSIANLPTGAQCSVTEDADARFSSSISAPVTIDDDGEEIVVTNTTSTLTITKTTLGATTHPLDLDASFSFAFDCGAGAMGTVVLTTSGQTASWDMASSPLVPPGTACTVTENGPPSGWTLNTAPSIELTTNAATIEEAAFVNERLVAPLEIVKTVVGEPTDLSDEEFTIDLSCTGGFETEPYLLGPLTLTENAPVVIDDLPVGAACEITEQPDGRFFPSYDPDDQTAIVQDGGTVAGIDNRTASLEITKQVVASADQPVDLTASFDFAVACTDGTNANVTIDIVDGVQQTLEYPDLPLVPDGTACTMTEQGPPTGWTLETPNDVEVVASSESPGVASFTNRRDTADLTVTKTVLGAPLGLDPSTLTFTIDVSCVGDFETSPRVFAGQEIQHGQTLTFPNLPTGTVCTITEEPDPRFATTYTPAEAAEAGVTIDADGVDVAIVNATGEIMIVKTTEVTSTHPVDVTDSFTFEVDCGATYSANHTVDASTVTSPTSATGFLRYDDLPALPDGTACSVSELGPPAGWTLASTNPVDLVVDSAGVVTASFTNTRDTGALTVTKALAGVPEGTDLDNETFDITIVCTGGFTTPTHTINGQISADTPLTIEQLPTGTNCAVSETPDPRFSTTIDPAVTIDTNGEAITVTNTTSTLSITKTTTGPTTHPINLDADFAFSITCTLGTTELYNATHTITTTNQNGTWATPNTPLLPPGTDCTITEQSPPTGWTNTSGNTHTLTTNANQIENAPFTNTRDTATLTVNKIVLGAPEGVDLSADLFDVTVTCQGDFAGGEHTVLGQVSASVALDINDLPTGATCEIVEAEDARFATTYFPANATDDGATATIEVTGSSVTIMNVTGAVIVAKLTVVPEQHPVDPVADFTFTIDCGSVYTADHTLTTDSLGGSGAGGAIFYTDLPLMPEGTSCEITEHDETPEWVLETDRTVELTVSSDDPATATFVNRRSETPLALTKLVEGPEGVDLSNEVFEVTVSCSGGFTVDPYVIVGEFGPAAPFAIEQLPYGAECSAVETPDERFAASDLSGAVVLGAEPAEIAFVNRTGSFTLDIDAIVNSTRPIDPDDNFTFTLTAVLPDGTVVNQTIDITTLDGSGTWASPLWPTGTVVTVTLNTAEQWALTDRDGNEVGNDGLELVIGTDVGTMGFEVQRNLTSLTIRKELANIPSNADFTNHAFGVEVVCTDGFVDTTYELPEAFTVSNVTALVIDELPVGSECQITEAPDEFFDPSYAPASSLTLVVDNAVNDNAAIDNAVNELTITNTGNDALRDEYDVSTTPLPVTGSNAVRLVSLAILLMLAGAVLVETSSRRRRNPAIDA